MIKVLFGVVKLALVVKKRSLTSDNFEALIGYQSELFKIKFTTTSSIY